MKKRILLLLALLILGGAAFWWSALPERLGWRGEADTELTLYGNVDIREAQLGFRVGGRILEMGAEEGDRVESGALLARLDPQPLKIAVRAAQAQVARETAQLAKLEAGPRPAEIAQARAALAERQAEFKNARQVLERALQLRPGGGIAQAQVDQAQAALDMAAARVASAESALRLLREGSRAEDIAAGQAALALARANLAAARTALDDTRLTAPFAGIILSRVRQAGEVVAPGATVYVLALSAPLWVRAYIGEPRLGDIAPGMQVTISSDSAPDRRYRGRIGFISPVAEFTPRTVQTPELRTDLVYRLRIRVEGDATGLRQGMPVSVHIPLTTPRPEPR